MFATTIRFSAPADTDWEVLRRALVRRAFDLDRNLRGLRSGALVFSPEQGEFGGDYVWETQDDAEAFLRSEAWRAMVAAHGEPSLLERAELCAYVEEGDLVFPPGYEVQASGPEASPPPGP